MLFLVHQLSHICFPPSARTYAGALRGRGSRGRRVGRGRGIVGKAATTSQPHAVQKLNNPFLVTASGSSSQSQNSDLNPFLGGGKVATTTALSSQQSHAQLAPPTSSTQSALFNPFLVNRATGNSQPPLPPPPPPSYASVVGGGGAVGVRQPAGPVPSFITHGPNSIQVQVSPTSLNNDPVTAQKVANPFVSGVPSQSTSAPGYTSTDFSLLGQPQFQPVPAIIAPNSAGVSLLGVPKFQTPASMPPNSVGTSLLGQPKLQMPVDIGVPHFPPQAAAGKLPSYDQATNFQPRMQAAMNAPLQVGAGSLPMNMTLHVKGVPDELNNPAFLEAHFSTFGPLNDIECNPQKKYATVTFRDKVHVILAVLYCSIIISLSLSHTHTHTPTHPLSL